ncbi:glycoside hydrolase family 73 protein [Jeotgalibaca sp. A127]|uniref:glycoside hydrolase family 73 protein n=1 Tax=Jeotgalibaca sp. A127 TaxID=3457324 RepID=UPI003FD6B8D8
MAIMKWNKQSKRRVRQIKQKVIGFLFACTVIFMAGYSINESYSSSNGAHSEALTLEKEQAFIQLILPVSQTMYEIYGIRPSVSIAQAILESDWGESELAAKYNNLYGRKTSDINNAILMETSEFTDGEWVIISDYFKVYSDVTESIEDHAKLMVEGTDWNPELYHPVIEAQTYQEASQALQQSGYATDPDYPQKLVEIIERYELYKYDVPR